MTILETHNDESCANCPGAGCTDQGCPAHYAEPTNLIATEHTKVAKLVTNLISPEHAEVAKLLEALEEMIDIAKAVDSWESFPSDPIERAEEALALYRQQRGDA